MSLKRGWLFCCYGPFTSVLLAMGLLIAPAVPVAQGDDSEQERTAQLRAMSPEKIEELLRKKQRFDVLSPEEQERLRELHIAIEKDEQAKELEETAKRFYLWLNTLTSPQRAALLTIPDPKERIGRIKELMQQQAEQRFREFLPNLTDEDRKVINKWVGDFVAAHEEDILKNVRPEWRDKARDEETRRRDLAMSWGFHYRRREPGTPIPTAEEFERLMSHLSAETKREIDQRATTPIERQAILDELVKRATFSRFFPQVSRDELLKFYTDMKADDPRRERLEPLEGEALYRELHGMYARERFGGPPGGPPGQRGGPLFGGRGGGPPGERRDFKGKRPPPDGEPPPPK